MPRREKRQDGCSLGWDCKQSRNALFESSSLWWETPGDFASYGELRSRGSWRIKKKKEEEEKEKESKERGRRRMGKRRGRRERRRGRRRGRRRKGMGEGEEGEGKRKRRWRNRDPRRRDGRAQSSAEELTAACPLWVLLESLGPLVDVS